MSLEVEVAEDALRRHRAVDLAGLGAEDLLLEHGGEVVDILLDQPPGVGQGGAGEVRLVAEELLDQGQVDG